MNNILAIDTSGEGCSVALKVGGKLLENFEPKPREHSKKLLAMIDELLTQAELSLKDLSGITYMKGPGSFTGLRIGVSIVQGLAYGAGLPTLGVSSLQCLAAGALLDPLVNVNQVLLPMLDARMHEVYWGLYKQKSGSPILLNNEAVSAPEDLPIRNFEGLNIVGVGTGWRYYSDMPEELKLYVTSVEVERTTRASDIFYVFPTLGAKESTFSFDMALPVYIRDTVTWKKLSEQKKLTGQT